MEYELGAWTWFLKLSKLCKTWRDLKKFGVFENEQNLTQLPCSSSWTDHYQDHIQVVEKLLFLSFFLSFVLFWITISWKLFVSFTQLISNAVSSSQVARRALACSHAKTSQSHASNTWLACNRYPFYIIIFNNCYFFPISTCQFIYFQSISSWMFNESSLSHTKTRNIINIC